METHFKVPELPDGFIQVAPYQARCLREALSVDENGLYRYSTVVWSDLKKSIKSTLTAAVALWLADMRPWTSIKIVANDLKQADSREMFYIRRAIEMNRAYFGRQRAVKIRGYRIEFPQNHSVIEAVALDPKGEAGGNDDLVVFTELWAAKSKAALQMWTEMTLSPTKYGKSMRWVETYAGFDGESPLLQRLYDQATKEGRTLWADEPDVFVNEPARLFCLWNTTPRLDWLTPEYYAQEAATLTETEFLRVHRNQWQASVNAYIPEAWWFACLDADILAPPKSVPVVIGVDASVSGDCTALVAVALHPALKEHIVVFHTQVWLPADCPGGKMDYDATLTPAIEALCQKHNVVQIAYDPYQLHHWAMQLRQRDIAWFREFNQGGDRLQADKRMYDLIRDRKLHHNGDKTLTEHVLGCNAKVAPGEDTKLRLVKRSDDYKIDAAVATSMACHEISRLDL